MQKRWLVMEDESQKVCSPYRTRIAGAGRQLPSTHMSTTEVMASTKHRTHIDLERLTGIHERRVSAGEHDSLTLATAAAQDSLRHAGRRVHLAGQRERRPTCAQRHEQGARVSDSG
jgi:3-oxoacyl-[acyl-carrier-protein] synthase III